MARAVKWVALGAALVVGPSVLAQAPERLTDKDVKGLIDVVNQARDRFEDQLEGKVKNSVLRGPSGEVDVSRFLDDFQENIGRLKDRFEPKYAASAETAAVLRQGSAIHRFMKQQPSDLKGASEWDHLASSLGRLASAYGTTFPVEGEAAVRRVSDGEAATAAEQIEEQAGEFKDSVNRTSSLPAPTKNALKTGADAVKSRAKTLASRLKDSKPATAEARMLFEAVQKLEESTKGASLAPPSLSLMGAMRSPLTTLRQAFGVGSAAGTAQ
jgi:hypothetical protein